jgi:hypothetical protein
MKQSSLVSDSEEVTVESVKSLADGQFLLALRQRPGKVFVRDAIDFLFMSETLGQSTNQHCQERFKDLELGEPICFSH